MGSNEDDDDDDTSTDEEDAQAGGAKLRVITDPAAKAKAEAVRRQKELSGKGVTSPSRSGNASDPARPRKVFVSPTANKDYGHFQTATNQIGAATNDGYERDGPLDSAVATGGYTKAPPPAEAEASSVDSSTSETSSSDSEDDVAPAAGGQGNVGGGVARRQATAQEEARAKRRAMAIKATVSTVAGVVIASTVATLIWYFLFGPGRSSSGTKDTGSRPVVKAHTGKFAKPGPADSVDVLDNAVAAVGKIDPGSLQIASMADKTAGFGTSLKVTGEGTWTVDAATHKISFAPVAGLARNPTPIQFRVSDTQTPPQTSDAAGLSLEYAAFAMPTLEPVAADIALTGQTSGATVVIDVASRAKPSDGHKIDKTSIQIDGGSDHFHVLTVLGQGVWMAGTDGTITFKPETGLTTNPNPIKYSIADDTTMRSKSALVSVAYSGAAPVVVPPIATAIDVTRFDVPPQPVGMAVKVSPVRIDIGPHVMTGTNAVDKTSVLFINTQTPVGVGGAVLAAYSKPVMNGTVALGYLQIDVPDQGVWTIETDPANASLRQIVFTPLAGIVDFPTAVYYAIADTKGIYSKAARITLFPELESLLAAGTALAQKSDSDFWSGLTTAFQPITDIDEVGAVLIALQALTEMALGQKAPSILTAANQISGTRLDALVTEFLASGSDPAKLMEIGAREVTDATTRLGATPLATRVLRLALMRSIYRQYLAKLAATMGGN